MATPPAELSPELDNVFLQDVNMDGAADIVQVRFREVDVWFNKAGTGWTRRTIARNTPAAPGFAPRIRFADIDGSATTDIIWAAAPTWQFIDPAGGERPRLLVGVDNGLGADTTVEYGSSADDYLSDLEEADTCGGCERFTWGEVRGDPDRRLRALSGEPSPYRSAGSPVVSTVVRSLSTTDRFNVLGREAQVSESRFAYHDGYYEGIEQEFRGFGAADAVTEGDWNNPTVLSRTHFLQGRRPSDIADDRLAANPNEALKGREVMTEVFDESGAFLSTSFASITDRHLLTGLDGREIHYAFVNETNELRYDTTPFDPGSGTLELGAVAYERFDGSVVVPLSSTMRTIAVRGARVSRVRATFDDVDPLGHVLRQTAHGHVAMDGSPIDGVIVSHTEPELLPSGWLWRTRRTFVTGHDAPGALGDTTNTYNAVGDLISATQVVTSPRTYAFGGESPEEGGAAGHVQLDEDLVASTVYDAWGNAVQSCAGAVASSFEDGCLRFGSVTYDGDYAQLAETERLAVSREGGTVSTLDYVGTWDRGLGAILGSEDPNHIEAHVTYDGLGRVTSVIAPNVAGCTGERPSTRIAYELTASPTSQPISLVHTTTELSCTGELGADVLESFVYVDGLGRARAALATGDDEHAWVRSGITTFDKKGSVRRTYQPDFYDGADVAFSSVVALPADIPYAVTRYDAFGRARGVIAEDGSVVWTSYHSLSTDVCDPLDNDPASEHYRTCTTARTDGHGRVVDQVLRNRDPDTGIGQQYRLWTYYRADGSVLGLVRTESDGARAVHWSAPLPERNVVRTFVYDSVGRRLSSDDPDTDDRTNPDEASNSWRYLFNRVGDLVAVRDPRGCGQNFFYDLGGRLVGEQYVGCAEAQTHRLEQPHGENLVGDLIANGYTAAPVRLDAVYHYDDYPAWWSEADLPAGHSGVLGRATGVSDRGQRAVLAYDDRGNVTWTARQVAVISDAIEMRASRPGGGGGGGGPPGSGGGPPGGTDPSDLPEIAEDDADDVPIGSVVYDELHTYTRTATFDHAGRPRSMLLPEDPDYDGAAPRLGGLLVYNRRGLPAQAAAIGDCDITQPSDAWVSDVGELSCGGGDVHTIVGAIEYLRDGLVASITYGDDLGGARVPTRSTTRYDRRRRPVHMRTERERTTPVDPLEPTLGAVTVVFDQELVWDAANNLVAQLDHRDPAEWPDGHRPQSVNVRHDALYRVIGAEYDYTQNDRSRRPEDIGTDWRDEFGQSATVDPMRQEPAAMAPARASDRVRSLTWSWDYLANTTEWTDDASSFYERSLGGITNGDDIDEVQRPSALYLASNIGDGTGLESGGGGYVEVEYGASGNLTTMVVHAQCGIDSACVDPGTDLSSRLTALNACECANEQRYEYRWDELNRLSEARRFDRTAAMGGRWDFAVRQRYRYDAANRRAVKQTLDLKGCRGGRPGGPPGLAPCERIALYVYPGDFERRGLVRDGDIYGANEVLGSETQYVVAGARWIERSGGVGGGEGFDRERRLTLGVSDLIQTTAAVMDVRSGLLVESSTYYPNGGRETFLNDDSALSTPEVTGFTGKEADEEVGVTYFGERYLVPRLGRWASADPLHVHARGGGEVLNSYHYVSGSVLAARDPLGLQERPAVPESEWAATTDHGAVAVSDAELPAALAELRPGDYFVLRPDSDDFQVSATSLEQLEDYADEHNVPLLRWTPGFGASLSRLAADDGLLSWLDRSLAEANLVDPTTAGDPNGVAQGMCSDCEGNEDLAFLFRAASVAYAVFALFEGGAGIFGDAYNSLRRVGIDWGDLSIDIDIGDLPSPNFDVPSLPAFDGDTTAAILRTNEGLELGLTSGGGPTAYRNYVTAGHTEGQAALILREEGSSGGVLIHNNPNGTCGYCDRQVPTLLPEGVELRVVPPPNAVPNNSRSVARPRTYRGNSRQPRPRVAGGGSD